MKIDKKTLEYIVMQDDENASYIVETIFHQFNDVLIASLKKKDLLTAIRDIIFDKGIDKVKEVEEAIVLLLKKNSKTAAENSKTDFSKFETTKERSVNTTAINFVEGIERSGLLTETEKQALFRVEDPAYQTPTLTYITDKAKWQYLRLATAKLRILKVLKIPI